MTEKHLPEDEAPLTGGEIAAFIKDVIFNSTRSRHHRGPISKGTLLELARIEREDSENYGVVR